MKVNEIWNNFVESDFRFPSAESDIGKLDLEMFFNQTVDNSLHISSNSTSGADVDIKIKCLNSDCRLEKRQTDYSLTRFYVKITNEIN